MSSKRLSPTGSILRTSRLFSLPPPLPRPNTDGTSNLTYNSDTATTPYPTRAAITTPKSSLGRGDWGLKRPLPLRATTRTTTPAVRVSVVDTFEHITDFESAADHAMTLRKWQDYNIPISKLSGQRRSSGINARSSFDPRTHSGFEGNFDVTDPEGQEAQEDGQRWKYRGPWLAGESEGDFLRYLESQIRRRKGEFREYVRRDAAERKAADRRRVAMERGNVLSPEDAADTSTISDQELQHCIVALRKDRNKLNDLVQSFLDLPAQPAVQTSDDYGTRPSLQQSVTVPANTEPHTTHPSAGLSYLRTTAHIANHPILGPQANHRPVEARVLIPPNTASGRRVLGKIGVGGIVTEGRFQLNTSMDKVIPGVTVFDPKLEGGGKVWVRPIYAEVDAGGRIKLSVDRASESEVALHLDGSTAAPDQNESASSPEDSQTQRARPNDRRNHTAPTDEAVGALYMQAHEALRKQVPTQSSTNVL